MKALVINGPNLNMLGIREPGIYGSDNYDRLVQICQEAGAAQGFDEVEVFQSNHEGNIVDKIQEAYGKVDGIVINPAAYTHTSVAILDALKAVAIPGYQVPFASREMPIGRGWGTGGLQVTLSCIGPDDVLKVIDQGSDASVNAVSIRSLVHETTGVETTTSTADATLIQSRHRIPERPLQREQLMVLQVPMPEPLRTYEARESVTRRLHAEGRIAAVVGRVCEPVPGGPAVHVVR